MTVFYFSILSVTGTKFCESLLLPADPALVKKSLQATFFNKNRNDTNLDTNDRLDSCCRSLHKCEAIKNIELGGTGDSIIPYCDCVHHFKGCLKNLNTTVSSNFAFIYSINVTKCYANEYPIIKCVNFENYIGSKSQNLRSQNSTLNNTFFNRCKQYEFDYSKPKELQLFDVPLHDSEMYNTMTGKLFQN